MKRTTIACSVAALAAGLAGGLMASPIMGKIKSARVAWDDATSKKWPAEFVKAATESGQPMYVHRADGTLKRPLVISLHTWSGGYDQRDELAPFARANNWNYIHPHVQGPNRTADACLSAKVVADAVDAYEWANANMNIDRDNVVIVGVSGGAYTALGLLLSDEIPVKEYFAWVPITDLSSWKKQSERRSSQYAKDVERCAMVDGRFSDEEARTRSPIFMTLKEGKTYPKLNLYAGVNDGYSGSVPVSHSLLFFNRMAKHYGAVDTDLVTTADMAKLTTLASDGDPNDAIGDRTIHFKKSMPHLNLTIFEGGHEMLVPYTAEQIEKSFSNSKQ